MFIELELRDNKGKILINFDRVESLRKVIRGCDEKTYTKIYADAQTFYVKEPYESLKEMLIGRRT